MLLEQVTAYLQTEGVGTVGTDLFWNLMPDQPDAVTVVREYGGLAPVVTHDDAVYERPRIQITCRAQTYAEARAQAERCWDALRRVRNRTIAGTRYLAITPLGPVFPIRRDDDQREFIGLNAEVQKERR